MTQFADPAAPSEGINWASLSGQLLMIEVLADEGEIVTSYGPNPAVRANVTVIDSQPPGATHDNTLVFPKILVSQTRPLVGQTILGRLTQGVAKSGQSPPWMLAAATEQDKQAAGQFVAQQAAQPAPAAQQAQQIHGQAPQPTQMQQQAPAQPQPQGGQVPF